MQERTQKVRELSAELAIAEQEERERIASVLHDNLQQELHAVQMWIRAIREGDVSDEHEELLDQMEETLDASIERTQTLSAELAPPVLEEESLTEVLEWLALHMEENYGLSVDVESGDRCRVPGEELRILVFHLVRELLFNVVKHAEVDEAQLRCCQPNDEQIVVEVIDEGTGFDVDALKEDRTDGFGLYSVRERLDMFGGHLDLESAPDEGTRATVVLPVENEDGG